MKKHFCTISTEVQNRTEMCMNTKRCNFTYFSLFAFLCMKSGANVLRTAGAAEG